MLKCSPTTTHIALIERLCSINGNVLSAEEATQYPNIVGGLQYLTVTCSDMSLVVNKVCRAFSDMCASVFTFGLALQH
jgi:hypothetical protein